MGQAVQPLGLALALAILLPGLDASVELPPIEQVNVGENRVFHVNGEQFFPLMIWLQDADNFPAVKACGVNTVVGYWNGSSATEDVVEYADLVGKAGFYGVLPFDARLKGRQQFPLEQPATFQELTMTVRSTHEVTSP